MPPVKRRARLGTITPFRPLTHLGSGRAALKRGAWKEARRHFRAALAREESPEALEGLGLAAWWLDQADLVFDSRQRAFRLYRQRNDRVAAARLAVWLAWDSAAFRGEMAVANGWLQRAHGLIDDQPVCPEQAWLGVREGVFALLEHSDPDRAVAIAEEAIDVSRRAGSTDFEMIAGALRGFALVTRGDVPAGMRQLDEVNVSVLAGELTDPVAIALTCCYLVGACERVRDSDRAGQWCVRLKRFCTRWGLRPLLAVCRTQYASMCVWLGDWAEAEKELVTATGELSASRPAMTGEGQARLGELRRRQGRFDEAAELFDAAGHHPLAMLGRATLSLDRGEAKKAADLADRYLRHLGAHSRTERAAGLDVLVRACAAAGAIDRARQASLDLDAIAHEVRIPPIDAVASLARGHLALAEGQADEARTCFEDAVDSFRKSSAPFETARARLDLARTLGQLAQAAEGLEEVRRAVKELDGLDAAFEQARARALERQLRTGEIRPRQAAGSGLTSREDEVLRLIAEGYSNDRIGKRLFISAHTVHRHVANIFTKLNVRTRSAAVARIRSPR